MDWKMTRQDQDQVLESQRGSEEIRGNQRKSYDDTSVNQLVNDTELSRLTALLASSHLPVRRS